MDDLMRYRAKAREGYILLTPSYPPRAFTSWMKTIGRDVARFAAADADMEAVHDQMEAERNEERRAQWESRRQFIYG